MAMAVAGLARQLGLSPGAWAGYAERDETRREHLAELQLHYGLRSFGIGQYRSLATWLMPTALQTNRGFRGADIDTKKLGHLDLLN